MAEAPTNPLPKQEASQIGAWLRQYLRGRVSLDVWTRDDPALVLPDRDVCTHGDEVARLTRQLASLHPWLLYTHYDFREHESRAAEAGIEHCPTTVVRGSGRAIQCVGLFGAGLFPAFLDIILMASTRETPLLASSRSALGTLETDVEIEAMLTPYDPYSPYLARLCAALAMETRRVRVRLLEMSEFPVLAGRRALTEIPVLSINGRRFTGLWEEAPLVQQIQRVVEGNDEPVVRDRVLAAPYYNEDQIRELAAQQAQEPGQSAPPQQSGSGLILP